MRVKLQRKTFLIKHTVNENITGGKITLVVINNASSIFSKRKQSGWILIRITHKMDLTQIVQNLFQLDEEMEKYPTDNVLMK